MVNDKLHKDRLEYEAELHTHIRMLQTRLADSERERHAMRDQNARGLVIGADTKSIRSDIFSIFHDACELLILDREGAPLYRLPIIAGKAE